MSSISVLRQPHISNRFCFREPQYCGCVKMEPFVLLAFFSLCKSNFLSNLRPIPVMMPIMVLFVFPLFCRHFGCLWVLPKLTVCPFWHPLWSFLHSKNTTLKGKCPIWREEYYKTWEKQKDKWFHFHACTSPSTHIFQCFCALATHTTKKFPKFAMCIFGTWVAQQVDSDLRPANSPKHATDAGVQLMWERVLCNSSAINSPNIFLCNRLHRMSLHISEK